MPLGENTPEDWAWACSQGQLSTALGCRSCPSPSLPYSPAPTPAAPMHQTVGFARGRLWSAKVPLSPRFLCSRCNQADLVRGRRREGRGLIALSPVLSYQLLWQGDGWECGDMSVLPTETFPFSGKWGQVPRLAHKKLLS